MTGARTLGPGLGLVALLTACGTSEQTPSAPTSASRGAPFVESAQAVGLDFQHFNGMTGRRYFSEHMGGGAALFDMEGDGDLDLFVTQGALIEPGRSLAEATPAWTELEAPTDRLYRNDLDQGSLRFTDVTESSGLEGTGYSMGVAVGDVDSDGLPDLFVTHWGGPNRLYLNEGDGRFRDVTEQAGVGDREWAISASFLDYDADGWLDLYVATYTAFSLPLHKACRTYTGALDYCGPQAFRPLPDRLYRNRGDGAFEDLSAASGIEAHPGAGLGVVSFDADGDGAPDLYVANDQMPNRMWRNSATAGAPGPRFQDEALANGTALNADGHAEAGMGIAIGDVDRDGEEDLLVTHLDRETHTLYRRRVFDGVATYYDATAESGLGSLTYASTGFGVGFLDYDNDGWLDLFVANGAVKLLEPLVRSGDPYPMRQANQLLRNLDGSQFVEVPDPIADPANGSIEPGVSRGAAFGDVDNDGDTDVVVVENSGPLRLLLNRVGGEAAWLGVEAVEVDGRSALGARVFLGAGAELQTRSIRRDGSYASANDPRALFGLGDSSSPQEIVVRWRDGASERWSGLETGRYHRVVRGEGLEVSP